MANANKARGTGWESDSVTYLNQCGLDAKRTGSARADESDIWAGEWTIEAKHEARIDLPGYLKQLATSVLKAGRVSWKSAVWVKNRRHGTGQGYAVRTIENERALMIYVTALENTLENITRNVLRGQEASDDRNLREHNEGLDRG